MRAFRYRVRCVDCLPVVLRPLFEGERNLKHVAKLGLVLTKPFLDDAF